MEKLYRHSNGSAVTLSDDCAVVIKQRSGRLASGAYFFEFFANPQSKKTRIEWTGEIAVIPDGIARLLLGHGWAMNITELQLSRWNDKVDAESTPTPPVASAATAAVAPIAVPEIKTPPPSTPVPPAVPVVKPLVLPVAVPADPKEAKRLAALKKAEDEAKKAAGGKTGDATD